MSGNQQEVLAICTAEQCPGIQLGPRWGQGEVSCQQFSRMKGPSCYFNPCWLFKIHPERARKKGRGTVFPFPSTSKAAFDTATEKHSFFPNLIIKIQSCYFLYIVDLRRLQYAGAEPGFLCVTPTRKRVGTGVGSPVLLSGGVWIGRKQVWQDTALVLPSVQTQCQEERVYPLGKKNISSHPILKQSFPHYGKINLKG